MLLALSFIFLVYDGTKWIADQSSQYEHARRDLGQYSSELADGAKPLAERLVGPWFWQGVVQRYLIDQPVWLVLAIIAAILILLGRKKKPLIGYARDQGSARSGRGAGLSASPPHIFPAITGDAAMFMFKKTLQFRLRPRRCLAVPSRSARRASISSFTVR